MKAGADLTDFRSVAIVAVGSNLTHDGKTPEKTVTAAVSALAATGFDVRAVSRFYDTPAFPTGSGPDFVNACAAYETTWPADRGLAHLHKAEAQFGRERAKRWAARTLDLDLIALGDAVVPDRAKVETWMSLPLELQGQATPSELLLPHPRMHERAFVLIPMADIAPTWRHPLLGRSVAEMVAALPGYMTEDVSVRPETATGR